MSRVVSAISDTNTYTDYGFDVKTITIGDTAEPTGTMVTIPVYKRAVTVNSKVKIDGSDPSAE